MFVLYEIFNVVFVQIMLYLLLISISTIAINECIHFPKFVYILQSKYIYVSLKLQVPVSVRS